MRRGEWGGWRIAFLPSGTFSGLFLSREREAHDPSAHSYMKEHQYDFPSLPLPLVLICSSGPAAVHVLSITFAWR